MSEEGVSRRRFLTQAGTVGAAGAAYGTGTVDSADARSQDGVTNNHPMFGANAANTGYSPSEPGVSAPVERQWWHGTDGGVSSSPVVTEATIYFGTDEGRVFALTAGGGTKKWRTQLPGPVVTSPAAVDGTVYIGCEDTNVYALNDNTGEQEWQFETGNPVRSSPAVVDETVYVGSDDGTLYALDTEDGTRQWAVETGSPVHSSPAVADGMVYVTHDDGMLYALTAEDGTQQWEFASDASSLSSPAVADGTVYVGTADNSVVALATDGGAVQWQQSVSGDTDSLPAVTDDTVYVTGEHLFALARDDGTERWRYPAGDSDGSLSNPTPPVVARETVYFGAADGTVRAVDAADASTVWQHETGGVMTSPPAVADEIVYLGGREDDIYTVGPKPKEPDLTPMLAVGLGPFLLFSLYGAMRVISENKDELAAQWE